MDAPQPRRTGRAREPTRRPGDALLHRPRGGLPGPGRAVAEVVRVARRFVLASVPSRPDDDPRRLHLFGPDALRDLFAAAGVTRVRFDFVLNRLVALATW